MKEYRVQGPPGTGKTEWLKTQLKHAADRYGANGVAVCSFTRSAAATVASRAQGIPRENIGTLHSLAFRAIPGVKIAEGEIAGFNEHCKGRGQPLMMLSDSGKRLAVPTDDIVESPQEGETPGDALLADMNRLRSRMVPRQAWPEHIKAFSVLWGEWKREAGLTDFTDLLELALLNVKTAPGNPAAFFGDESQDFTRLGFRLLRKWGEQCLTFVHVGDPDQILYEWAGVEVGNFFSPLPEAQTRLLAQSYRVPRSVHAAAVRWINETPGRKPIEYRPRDFDGEIRRNVRAKYTDPGYAIDDALSQVEQGKSVMFLVSCSFMLNTIIARLKADGIPFHNPFRVAQGNWNPLRIGSNGPAARLAAFLTANPAFAGADARLWTWEEIRRWTEWLPTKTHFRRGAKAEIERRAKETPNDTADVNEVTTLFVETAWEDVVDCNPEFWFNGIGEDNRKKVEFPAKVLKRCGFAGLRQTPKVIVSTIHAAKGGEADIVYLFPDLSPSGYKEWLAGGPGKEGVRRAFYVALTRAREQVVICNSASNMAVRL